MIPVFRRNPDCCMLPGFHIYPGFYVVPVLHKNPDSHISATAYHNMDPIFSSGPFHYLFLTALVHPLSTCAHHLFLSHCNNYILPSHSRQPKLASCILYLPVGASIPVLLLLLQLACFSLISGWSRSACFATFAPTRLQASLQRYMAWGIITQKSPRAMWSSAGLLEKGVDYKFHVREFMFRCS